MTVVVLTGAAASPLSEMADVAFQVPSSDTPMIQQAHISIIHALCEQVDRVLLGADHGAAESGSAQG